MLKVLVTGSSGQVGTNLSLALMKKGVSVLGIDRRPNTWTDQIPCYSAIWPLRACLPHKC